MQSQDRDLALNYAIAELRFSIAFITLHLLEIKAGFREDQPRGSDGRWSGGAGTVIVTRKDKTGDPKIDRYIDTMVDVVKEIVETTDSGRGALYGVVIHTKVAARLRELNLPGIGRHGIEQSFSAGDLVRYGLDGSVRTDVILRDGRTAAAPIRAISDLKTGNARLTPARARELREAAGVDDSVPVIEVHVSRGITVKNLSLSSAMIEVVIP